MLLTPASLRTVCYATRGLANWQALAILDLGLALKACLVRMLLRQSLPALARRLAVTAITHNCLSKCLRKAGPGRQILSGQSGLRLEPRLGPGDFKGLAAQHQNYSSHQRKREKPACMD